MPQQHTISSKLIRTIWGYWAVSFGALTAVMVLSLFIPKVWLPLLTLGLAYAVLSGIQKPNKANEIPNCSLMTRGAALILFWSAIVMAVINLLHAHWFFGAPLNIEPYNPKHPYICSLVVFPIAVVILLYMLVMGNKLPSCRECQIRYNFYPGTGVVSTLYYHESQFQLTMMIWISLIISIVNTIYYFFFYVNVNYNNRDFFFFILFPTAVYLISLVYMTARYSSMLEQTNDKANLRHHLLPAKSAIRFLIISGDKILLKTDMDNIVDTPAMKIKEQVSSISDEQARKYFEELSNIKDFTLKYIYTDDGIANGANIFHYAVFLNDEAKGRLGGEWETIDKFDRLLKSGMIAPLLVNEIHRIYNVTMAWKTYSRDGRRLYPIKNYHPTFRLRDLKDWEVNYNDLHWLHVATNNEDKAFFRIRRVWRKVFRHA